MDGRGTSPQSIRQQYGGDPLWLALMAGVLDHDAHAMSQVIVDRHGRLAGRMLDTKRRAYSLSALCGLRLSETGQETDITSRNETSTLFVP
jgi:hypothetical protein